MSRSDVFTIGWDEDGLHVSFNIDDVSSRRTHTIELDGQVHVVLDGMTAIELHDKMVAEVGEHAATYRQEKAAFQRATPAERARVIHGDDFRCDESGYELDDPKHPTYHDRMSAHHDERSDR